MTVTQFIDMYNERHPQGHFFDKGTLRFFGEQRGTMKLAKDFVKAKDAAGMEHTCYALSAIQKNHPAGPTRVTHYFDAFTLEPITQ